MLKAKVGYSINPDPFVAGLESAKQSTKDLSNVKINFLFTSADNNIKKYLKGLQEVTPSPVIGCTSSTGIIVPDGYISSPTGFAGAMSFSDQNLIVGVACHEAGRNPREIGRKVAIKAVEDANKMRSPAYFYMVATPKDEEDYLMGIQDVIGRVPMFGGSAADDTLEENWKIICNNRVIDDGVAVAFFYTDTEITTTFTGDYKETNNIGIVTEVKNNRTIVSIDEVSALKKYAHWVELPPSSLQGKDLLIHSFTKPLGIKEPLGNLTIVRQPKFGNDEGTKTITDDTITLGNKIVEKTAVIQLEATIDDLIASTQTTLKDVKNKLYNEPAAYILVHDAGRRAAIGGRIDEVYRQILKEARGVPFIMPFTYGEYGYNEHSSNICGGLMLSFTAFAKN